ncbi:hypothetical protein EJ110_NYTH42416 [Nymphaea thermarum]|nr:hypothetical protein EJ110_NYTH42416 [Nymphaea thermarum]
MPRRHQHPHRHPHPTLRAMANPNKVTLRDVMAAVEGHKIPVELFTLAMAGADLVLGIQWLHSLGEVVWDFVGIFLHPPPLLPPPTVAVFASGVFLLRRLRTLLSLPPSQPPVDIALAVAPCSLTSPSAVTCFLMSPSWFALLPLVSSGVAGASLVLPLPVPFVGLVITLRLTKENYFMWSAAMTMGIAGRGRIAYIDGRNPEPAMTSGVWDTWFLEDNQVKTWIVNSVSADIQPLILWKKTARDMWVILEQIIEDVYSCIEAEEQRRLVTTEGKKDLMPYHERSALVSRGPGGTTISLRRCTYCNKTGHTVDYCWDLHPEKKGNKGRSSIGKTPMSEVPKSSGDKVSIFADQIRELRAYLGRIDVNQEGVTLQLRRKVVVCLDRSTLDEVLGQRR